MATSRILITGGLGFIGGSLAKNIEGKEVIILDNYSSNTYTANDLPNCKVIRGSILDYSLLEDIIKTVDIVYHFAAMVSIYDCDKDVDKCDTINVQASVAIVDLCNKYNCHLVFSDTSAQYEGVELPLHGYSENTVKPITAYAISKHKALDYIEKYSNSYIVFRFFNVSGPYIDINRTVPPLFAGVALRLLNKKPVIIFGNGERSRDFVHIDDVVHLLLKYTTNYLYYGQVYNIGTGLHYTLNNIVARIAKYLNIVEYKVNHLDNINNEASVIFSDSSKLPHLYKPIDIIIKDTVDYLKRLDIPKGFMDIDYKKVAL